MKLVEWIKTHKLSTVLLLVVAYFLFTSFTSQYGGFDISSSSRMAVPMAGGGGYYQEMADASVGAPAGFPSVAGGLGKIASNIVSPREPAPVSQTNRLVVASSHLSLLVEKVVAVNDQILSYVKEIGGYMVNDQISNPDDAPTATITVRVPSEKLTETLTFLRGLSVKVVNENLDGYDVTDQYVDIEAHIANLQKTKAKYEEILGRASEISDISNLTQQIISVQNQIDNYKGQQKSLEQNASLSKITIYLSSDEIALPYAPSEAWRPNVIFKLAVRSLISHLRDLGTILIWLGVYAVIWVPVGLAAFFAWRFWNKRSSSK